MCYWLVRLPYFHNNVYSSSALTWQLHTVSQHRIATDTSYVCICSLWSRYREFCIFEQVFCQSICNTLLIECFRLICLSPIEVRFKGGHLNLPFYFEKSYVTLNIIVNRTCLSAWAQRQSKSQSDMLLDNKASCSPGCCNIMFYYYFNIHKNKNIKQSFIQLNNNSVMMPAWRTLLFKYFLYYSAISVLVFVNTLVTCFECLKYFSLQKILAIHTKLHRISMEITLSQRSLTTKYRPNFITVMYNITIYNVGDKLWFHLWVHHD